MSTEAWVVRQWARLVEDSEDEIILTRGIVWTARYYRGWDSIEGVGDTQQEALRELRAGLVKRRARPETGWHRVDLDAFDRAAQLPDDLAEIGRRGR